MKTIVLTADQGIPELSFGADQVYLLTGKINSGKTTALKKWIAEWQQLFSINGVISEPVFQNEIKIAYHGVEIGSGKIYPIVRSTPFRQDSNYQMGRFYFNELAYQKLTKHLTCVKNTDLMVIDEIGPLEIFKRRGFFNLMNHLVTHTAFSQLWVVRDSCKDNLIELMSAITK